MSTESESATGATSEKSGAEAEAERPATPVVIPPAKKVKGPTGTGDTQAPARPASARPGGRVAGAKAPTATAAVPVVIPASGDAEASSDTKAPAAAKAASPAAVKATTTTPVVIPATAKPAAEPAATKGPVLAGAGMPVPAAAPASEAIPSFSPGPATASQDSPRPKKSAATITASTSTGPAGERRTKVSISRISPWSVMKLSFLLSIAVGIGIVVVFYVFWTALDKAEVFVKLNNLIVEIAGSDFFPLLKYVQYDRVMSLAVLLAVADIVIITLLSTLGAVIYNLVANLVGGLHVTLTDE